MALPRRKPGARIVFGLTIAASVINVWPVLELVPVWRQPPPVYGALANARHVVLAEFPVFRDFAYDTPYMYFSLWHWVPMMNGYSGFKPKSFETYEAGVADFPGPVSMATMKMRGVTHVTVNCGLYRGGCPELLARLETMSELRKISEGLWRGQPVRLYELVR